MNEEPVRVMWATPPKEGVANTLGYQTHIKYLKRFCEKENVMVEDPDSPIAFHIISADHFKPIPNKFNVLFTMWECLDVPKTYVEAFAKANLIVVPNKWCKDLFQKWTRVPVEVCWHGTDTEVYQYHDRKNQLTAEKRFRFLWVGAPNPRKGYAEVLATVSLAERFPNIEIYLKTTVPKITWLDTLRSLKNNWRKLFDFTDYEKELSEKGMVIKSGHPKDWRKAFWLNLLKLPRPNIANKLRRFGKHKNIVFDTRKIPREELIQLYKSANCFLFPTWGEGWGLTLSEAMATGCPSIAARVTGVCEFFDSRVGYEIDYKVQEHELRDYNMTARIYKPDPISLVQKMLYVLKNYDEALRKGKEASDRMKTKFTWEQSAHRIAKIIRSHYVHHSSGS